MIDALRSDHHAILGEGVWGRVYDLGDGTVLKVAKEEGGIGSGGAKLLHEMMALRAFQSRASSPVADMLPRMLGHGDVPPTHELFGQGFRYWLHSTRLSGRPIVLSEASLLNDAGKMVLASSLGEALADFHVFMGGTGISPRLQPDRILTDPDTAKGLSAADKTRLARVREYFASSADMKPIHGDFNISNILLNDRFAVTGILDFAEACLGDYEDDLCSLTQELPELKEAIVGVYERRSGYVVDRAKLRRAEMKRNLISVLICRYRLGRPEEASVAERRLDFLLA